MLFTDEPEFEGKPPSTFSIGYLVYLVEQKMNTLDDLKGDNKQKLYHFLEGI